MKKLTMVLCVLSVVLWVGTSAWAQGRGRGGGKNAEQPTKDAPTDVAKPKGQDRLAEAEKKADEARKSAEQAKGRAAKDIEGARGAAKKQGDAIEKGKGKDRQQQLQAQQKQMQHELAKHMQRQARLNRLLELAKKEGNPETIARVEKLIAAENTRFERKGQQMQQRGPGETTTQPPAGQPGATTPEASKDKPAEAGGAPGTQPTQPPTTGGAPGGAADTTAPPTPPAQGGQTPPQQ